MTARFWFLTEPEGQLRAEWLDSNYERVSCPEASGSVGGKHIAGSTVLVDPRGVKGFTWTYDALLVSPKVLRLFEQHRITGFEVKPVKAVFADDIELTPPDLHRLVITGWGGLPAPAAGVHLVRGCSVCGFKVYVIEDPSQLIDASAWDGSDLFRVWPVPRTLFASDRVADILRHEKISGLELIPALDIPWEKGAQAGPGLLSDYMSFERARELDHRFGVSDWLMETRQGNSHRLPALSR
jgi:hypothetical protein